MDRLPTEEELSKMHASGRHALRAMKPIIRTINEAYEKKNYKQASISAVRLAQSLQTFSQMAFMHAQMHEAVIVQKKKKEEEKGAITREQFAESLEVEKSALWTPPEAKS